MKIQPDQAQQELPKLPEAFVEQTARQLGDELPAFLHAMSEEPKRGLRHQTLKGAPVPAPGELEPIPWAENAFFLSGDSPAGAVPLHEAGAWYIQEPSAMLPAAVLNVKPGERVLDLCAAPGGKATQLGDKIGRAHV